VRRRRSAYSSAIDGDRHDRSQTPVQQVRGAGAAWKTFLNSATSPSSTRGRARLALRRRRRTSWGGRGTCIVRSYDRNGPRDHDSCPTLAGSPPAAVPQPQGPKTAALPIGDHLITPVANPLGFDRRPGAAGVQPRRPVASGRCRLRRAAAGARRSSARLADRGKAGHAGEVRDEQRLGAVERRQDPDRHIEHAAMQVRCGA
jgi:hypothetical protein